MELGCRPAWYSPAYLVECIMFLMGRYAEVPDPQVKDERRLGSSPHGPPLPQGQRA